jgi:hypothetical protein
MEGLSAAYGGTILTHQADDGLQRRDGHRRPDGADDAAVRAAGKVSEALETSERARGHLYSFHQLTGHADLLLDEAVQELRDTGHADLADYLTEELIGRNVLPGRWSFQVVEDYDDGYYACFKKIESAVRERLTGGRRHVLEAEMKERRRTHGHLAHSAVPAESAPHPTKE